MKRNTDLVGKLITIDEVQYLIDKVTISDGRNNENGSANIQKFRVELITLDFLTPPNQKEVPPEKEIKGIAIEFSEEQFHNKVTTVKVLCKTFGIGIIDAKHLVENSKNNVVKLMMPTLTEPMQFLRDKIKQLEEYIPKNNFTASFYY